MFRSRRVTVTLLAGCFALAAILLVALNAFNLHFLNPRDSNGIFLFTALSILVFLKAPGLRRLTQERGLVRIAGVSAGVIHRDGRGRGRRSRGLRGRGAAPGR